MVRRYCLVAESELSDGLELPSWHPELPQSDEMVAETSENVRDEVPELPQRVEMATVLVSSQALTFAFSVSVSGVAKFGGIGLSVVANIRS